MMAVAAGAQSWTFDSGAQEWKVRDLSNYADTGTTYSVDWLPTGGATGGYISRIDPSGGYYFFDAPITPATDYSAYIGGVLDFSLRGDFNDWTADSNVVLRGVSGGNATTLLGHVPVFQETGTWLTYSLALKATAFELAANPGTVPSPEVFRDVMSSLSMFLLPAEFGNGVKETTALDSVLITSIPEPATYAALLGGSILALVTIRRYRRR